MPPFNIKERPKARWPKKERIPVKKYDKVRWIPIGNVAPTVTEFIPSGYVGEPMAKGNTTTADLLRPDLKTRVTICYIIKDIDDGETPAQLDLDVGGFGCDEDGEPESSGFWLWAIIQAVKAFFRRLFGLQP